MKVHRFSTEQLCPLFRVRAALYVEGFDGFVTSAAAPTATGWSDPVAGRELHPLKTQTFSRRTMSPFSLLRRGSGRPLFVRTQAGGEGVPTGWSKLSPIVRLDRGARPPNQGFPGRATGQGGALWGLRPVGQRGLGERGDQSRHGRVRGGVDPAMVGSDGACGLPGGEGVADH